VRLAKLTLLFVVGLVLLLAITGVTYEASSSARDRRLYPPPGKLVDIGGRELHINCTGQGSPAVILDAGLGDISSYWFLVQPEIAKFTQVCSYDRARLGWSDPDPTPRSAHRISSDLDELLIRTVPPPYILVGHSGGGYWSRVYTSEYPDKVVGLVFVDSADKQQNRRMARLADEDFEESEREGRRTIRLMPFGIPRILGWCNAFDVSDLPQIKPILPKLTALSCRKTALETTSHEFEGFRNSDGEVTVLKPIPLVVLSHDPARWSSPAYVAQAQLIWDQMQGELTHLSPNSYRLIAKGSDHHIEVERPELVVEAVRRVYDSATHNAPIQQPTTGGQVQ